jgi:hypothetical protein
MRLLPAMERIWRSGEYIGDQRPTLRVTVQRPKMALRSFGVMTSFRYVNPPLSATPTAMDILNASNIDPNHGRKVTQSYADFLFSNESPPKELPDLVIKSCDWSTSLDSDAGTMTLTMFNSMPGEQPSSALPMPGDGSQTPSTRRDLDYLAYYTYNRGQSQWSKRWGHAKDLWTGWIMPDNIVRTYQGYGRSTFVPPELDPNLAITGTWLIDSVEMTALGLMTDQCRNMARLLLDQHTGEPVVPHDFNDPMSFQNWDTKIATPPVRTRVPLSISDTSSRYGPYKTSEGLVDVPNFDTERYRGHAPGDVLDDSAQSYWMSFAHIKPRWPWGVEWIEVKMHPSRIEIIKTWLVGHGYTVYVSVFADGHWRNKRGLPAGGGDPKISWTPNPTNPTRDQQARVPYMMSFTAGERFKQGLTSISLPVPVDKVTKVRLSFTNLQRLPGITKLTDFRFGMRSLQVFGAEKPGQANLKKGPAGANPGRYSDYTDIVKLCCAWGGLYWPSNGFSKYADESSHPVSYRRSDPVLGVYGRVWGDFEQTGTSGGAEIPVDSLENKSLMDVINMVRDVIGFIFFIDETGAAQWRLPNLYEKGNWITDRSVNAGRTVKVRTIDERENLTDVSPTISSQNIRDTYQVQNYTTTKTAAGYNPNPTGLRKIGIWADDRFYDADLQRAADMISIRGLFTYRTDRVTIPGFPGIQIDDQVTVMERATSEGFIHYVSGIESSHDVTTGEWTYTLTTNWLGDRPDGVWALPPRGLPGEITNHLSKVRARAQIRSTVT